MAPQSGVSPLQELRIQAQWKEIDKKLQHIKLRWFYKNYEKVYLNPVAQDDKKQKKTARMAAELMMMRKIRFQNERQERRKFQRNKEVLPPYVEDEPITTDELAISSPMRPVPDHIRDELYQGISHNDEGRKKYLKLRNKMPLEEKFYEPQTGHQEYGWDVENRYVPCRRYGKIAIIKNSFSRRNGSMKFDSQYWRQPMSGGLPDYLT